MTSTSSPPAASPAKELDHLTVTIESGGILCYRDVHPEGDATIAQITAAMVRDFDFMNPLTESGFIAERRGNQLVVLATYNWSLDDTGLQGEIVEVTAHFYDESSEEIPL
jgi:hypothetical protein